MTSGDHLTPRDDLRVGVLGVPLGQMRLGSRFSLQVRARITGLAGFPLQSLTRTRSMSMRLVVVGFLLIMVDCQAQQPITGNCDYPNQMTIDSPYAFTLRSDSSLQTITVTAIGTKQLLYTIDLERPDALVMSGKTVERIQGTATWSGCYGGVTSDGVMHPDLWEYKSSDGLLTIALYGEYVTHIELTMVPIVQSPIPRNGYIDE